MFGCEQPHENAFNQENIFPLEHQNLQDMSKDKRQFLDAGFADEAYARYAVEATYATTNLATFKAVAPRHTEGDHPA